MTAQQTRRAVVIGAGSGMGRAGAERLRRDGYELVLADLRPESLADLARRLDAEAVGLDVADPQGVAALARRCSDGVDALFHTAGLSMSMASFDRIMAVNLGGTARVLEAFAPVMRRGGAAVCLSSIAGHLVGPQDPAVMAALDDPLAADMPEQVGRLLPAEARIPGMAYGLSKLGVLRLVQRTAVAWGRNGVRVCSISPGVMDTPMGDIERKSNPEAEAAIGLGPVPRLGAPEEVANVAAFLLSPEASYVTACDILVDGGWVGAIMTSSPDSPFAQALAAGRAKN